MEWNSSGREYNAVRECKTKKYITSKLSLTVYSFQQILDQPDTREQIRDQEGSLRNGHKDAESGGEQQKLDSSETNNSSNDKTIRAHSIDKQKEKRLDDYGEKKEDQRKKRVSSENGNEVVQEGNIVSDEEEGQQENYVIAKVNEKGDE